MNSLVKNVAVTSIILGVISCGGGGSGSSTIANEQSINPGEDQIAFDEAGDESSAGEGGEQMQNDPESLPQQTGDPNLVVNCGLELPCSWVTQDNKFRFCVTAADPSISGGIFAASGFLGEETLILDSNGVQAIDSNGIQHDTRSVSATESTISNRRENSIFNESISIPGGNIRFRDNLFMSSVTLPFMSSTGVSYNVRFQNIPAESIGIVPCRNLDFSGVPALDEDFFQGGWRCGDNDSTSFMNINFRTNGRTGTVSASSVGGFSTNRRSYAINWEFDSRRLFATVVTGETIEMTNFRRIGNDKFFSTIRVNDVVQSVDRCFG